VIQWQGETLREIEKQVILSALKAHNYHITKTAISLGISRATFYRRLEQFNIIVVKARDEAGLLPANSKFFR
jgi:transcriptional regulator of acetoin/glycerol metabolism